MQGRAGSIAPFSEPNFQEGSQFGPYKGDDGIAKIAVVAAYIIMVLSNALSATGFFGGSIGSVSESTYVTPDGLTFSVWGLIYLLLFVLTVAQCCASPEDEMLLNRRDCLAGLSVRWRLVLAFVLNAFWLPTFSLYLFPLSLIIIVAYLKILVSILMDVNAKTTKKHVPVASLRRAGVCERQLVGGGDHGKLLHRGRAVGLDGPVRGQRHGHRRIARCRPGRGLGIIDGHCLARCALGTYGCMGAARPISHAYCTWRELPDRGHEPRVGAGGAVGCDLACCGLAGWLAAGLVDVVPEPPSALCSARCRPSHDDVASLSAGICVRLGFFLPLGPSDGNLNLDALLGASKRF